MPNTPSRDLSKFVTVRSDGFMISRRKANSKNSKTNCTMSRVSCGEAKTTEATLLCSEQSCTTLASFT